MLMQVHTGLSLEAKDLEEPLVEHTVLHSEEESFQNQPSDMETMTLAQGATTELKWSRTIGGMDVALDNSAGGGDLRRKTPKVRKAQRKQIRLQLSFLFIAVLVVCNIWLSDNAPAMIAELTVSDLFGNYTPDVIATTDTSPAMIAATENLWEDDSDALPSWLKDYMEWHHDTRQKLNESNWQNYKYILLRCVEADDKCAGAADRLKMIPMQILLAEQAKRLFFIHWSRPAALEEFLVPPAGGLDWRLPAWLAEKIDANAAGPIWKMNAKGWRNNSTPVIRVRNILYASGYYDEHRLEGEIGMWEAYHGIWKAVFTPSAPVQALIDQNLHDLGLTPNNYVAAHVRAAYTRDTIGKHEEIRAVNCAAQLAGNATSSTPIYFASDSAVTTRMALEYGIQQRLPVVGRNVTVEPLHLDRGSTFLKDTFKTAANDWKGRPASDFYDTFVDLYLLALSKCSTFGQGGYGSWAAALSSHDRTCKAINHRRVQCKAVTST
jgi:hypothetical protein